MHVRNVKITAIPLFERIFWILTGIPVGLLVADKATYVGGSLFPNWMGLLWWLGIAISLAAIILCVIRCPFCRFFSKRTVLFLIFGVLIFGTGCGICFGDMLAFLEHSPYLEHALYRNLCAIGAGIAIAILIVLLFEETISVFTNNYKLRGGIYTAFLNIRHISPVSWLTLLLIFGGTALFLANSRALYYWDNAIYHSLSRILEKEIAAQPLTVLEQVYYTIQTWDYNYLGALLPAVFMRFFGSSRGVFVVVCMGLYLITAVMVFYLINRRIGNSLKAPRYSGVIFLGIVLGFPLLPFLTLNGSIDVGGVTLMLLCCYLYFDEEKPYFPRYLLCGLLLLLLVLFRRWYMFWSVAFLIVAAIDRFVRAVENREARIKSVKNWFLRHGSPVWKLWRAVCAVF